MKLRTILALIALATAAFVFAACAPKEEPPPAAEAPAAPAETDRMVTLQNSPTVAVDSAGSLLLTGWYDTDLDLDDSFGLSASAGVDIPFGEHWMFNAGIWYIDIDTEAEITAKSGGSEAAKVKFDVDIDPWVYNIGVAYKF